MRQDFTPTLWSPDDRVVQTLFPGAHSDVGGGYPVSNGESGLSDHALAWMIGKLGGQDLKFTKQWNQGLAPDAGGCAHEPWNHCRVRLKTASRQFPGAPELGVHQSLIDRLGQNVKPDTDKGPTRYAPGNLGGYITETTPAADVKIDA